jgi:hypothetical protein
MFYNLTICCRIIKINFPDNKNSSYGTSNRTYHCHPIYNIHLLNPPFKKRWSQKARNLDLKNCAKFLAQPFLKG